MVMFASKDDLASKVEWEGGLAEALDYGVKSSELPAETPDAVREAWRRAEELNDELHSELSVIDGWLE